MDSLAGSVGRLLAGVGLVALAGGAPAFAAEATNDPERTYAPTDIIVIAHVPGYSTDDGSSSTKTPTALIDTPQAISVITRDQLDDQNIRQLGDALRYVPGVSMESGEGHRDEVFIRGQETTADFYLNGLRDDAQYYRALYNVDRVEVLKGANALTFGRGGGGGIVNRVTKTADPVQEFFRANASLDSFGAFALSGDLNQPILGEVGVRINAAYEEFKNHRDFYNGHFIGFAPTVTANLTEDTRLILGYSYDEDQRLTDRGVPSFNGLPLAGFDKTLFGDPDFNRFDSQVHIARARIDHDFSDQLSANLAFQYAQYDKVYANLVPAGTDGSDVTLAGYRNDTQRENWIGQGNLVWQGKTGAIGHTVLAGFEALRQDTGDSRSLVEFASAGGPVSSISVPLARVLDIPPVSLTGLSRSRDSQLTTLSAYFQDQIEIGDMIQLIAGIRFESFDLETVNRLSSSANDRKDEKWSPRFGVVFKPRQNVSIYASYTESFLPQAGDQFVTLNSETAELAPEKFENYELGFKWAPRSQLLVTGAIFRLDRSNTRAPDPGGSGLSVLTGSTRVEGFELGVAGDMQENWHINAGYTYLDGEIRNETHSAPAGARLAQLPKHHFAIWSLYDFAEGIGVGLGLVHSSKQFASVSNSVVLPSYTRVDAAVTFELSDQITLQANVENLFDEGYYPSAHGNNNIQPAKPLNASVSARVSF